MRFTIVTPSFNQGRFLRDCIESVRAQTLVEWEHIVIDAGSTDETLEVLKAYPHLQWISEPDKGQSDGINKGFRRATGDWVMWLNGDDYLLPGALARVAAFAEQHPEADVIYGGWRFVDEEKKEIKVARPIGFDLGMMIHYGCYLGSTSTFYRRRTVTDTCLLNENFRYVMDTEFYARLGRLGKRFVQIDATLACFRMHAQNQSMRHRSGGSIDEELRRQRQLAESITIRRAYGWTPFAAAPALGITDGFLWYFYRLKIISIKLFHRCFPAESDGATGPRESENSP